jgi:two-component system invasion response regulator UvrY
MIQIVVADDHPVVRAGIKQIVAEAPDLQVGAEVGDGRELLNLLKEGSFDVIVLDISMPGMDGLELVKLLKNDHPRLPILILTLHPETRYAVRFLRAGADGYLTKANAADELIKAIRKVYGGGKYISAELAEKLASNLDPGSRQHPHEILSDREYQVMLRLASGKTVKEIGDELALSVKTVSTYRTRVLEKMNMKNNAQLMLYAINNNLVEQ